VGGGMKDSVRFHDLLLRVNGLSSLTANRVKPLDSDGWILVEKIYHF
jgi:hypothetical protein